MTIASGNRVALWADQSGQGQDWIGGGSTPQPSLFPYSLGDSIDGVPVFSFGVAGDANKVFRTAGLFHDRFALPMDGARARTIFVVAKPHFDAAYARTGGPLWEANSWCSYFFLDPGGIFGPLNGAYAWMDNIGAFGVANQFTPVPGGAGGPYDNVGTLAIFFSAARPDLGFRVDNNPTPLTPAPMNGAAGPPSIASFGDGLPCFLGAVGEILVYDYDQRTAPADLAQTLAYLRSRYPSIAIAA